MTKGKKKAYIPHGNSTDHRPFPILGYHTYETPRHDEPKIIPL